MPPCAASAAVIAPGGTPRALAAGTGRGSGSGSPTSREAAPASGALKADARVRALGAPPCGPVVTGGHGDPDLLIASDLPLTGQQRLTQPMAAAVEYVLRRHGFRAGRFTLGLQSCDDATERYGVWDRPSARRTGARTRPTRR